MMSSVPAPGKLRIFTGLPNPIGAGESQLYCFAGDATAAPIQAVELAPGVALPQSPGTLDSGEFFLRIYHFNDLHGHLTRMTAGDGNGIEAPVISRLAWQIRSDRQQSRAEQHTGILVLAAGDDCSGSIFDEMLAADEHSCSDPQAGSVHPGYRLYSALGVDAAGLGNHDLDLGLPFLAWAIRHEARFPVLAANLRGCQDLSQVCFPAALLVVRGIRVGLIGLVTRAETRLDSAICQIVDPIAVANHLVPAIRPLCEVLILISHLGYSLDDNSVPMCDAGDVELAQSLPYGSVHLIVGGHSHSALNPRGLRAENIVNGIPIVQAGARGEYLGKVDITVRKKTVTARDARLIPTDNLPVDQAFETEEMQPYMHRARRLASRSLGLVENNPELSTEAVQNGFAAGELALANFVTDAMVDRLERSGQPVDCAMIDASCLLRGLPVGGALTLGDWFEVMPYADTIRLLRITGRQLIDLLDDNARRIDRAGEPHAERGFLQFSRQLRYEINLGGERAAARAQQATLRGAPLAQHEGRAFIVAATCFTRELAAAWETAWPADWDRAPVRLHDFPYTDTNIFLRQELVAYIQEHGGVTCEAGARRDGRLSVQE